jgi:hypothetical protein
MKLQLNKINTVPMVLPVIALRKIPRVEKKIFLEGTLLAIEGVYKPITIPTSGVVLGRNNPVMNKNNPLNNAKSAIVFKLDRGFFRGSISIDPCLFGGEPFIPRSAVLRGTLIEIRMAVGVSTNYSS